MSFLSGGGTAVPDAFTLGTQFKYQYASWLNYIDPGGSDITTWANFAGLDGFNLRDLIENMSTASGGNPYVDLEAIDPTDDLATIQRRMDAFADAVTALNPISDMDEAVRTAKRLVDGVILDDSRIDEMVDAFEQRTRRRHLRALMHIRDGYGMADAGLSSTMRSELVAAEHDRAQEVNEFEQQLRMKKDAERNQIIVDMSARYMSALGARLDALRAVSQLQFDVSKLNIVAKQDRQEKDLEYELQDAFWDPNLIKEGFSALQVGSGLPMQPRTPNKAERFIQQVLTSASFATQLGTAFGSPGVGAAGGAALLALNLIANNSGR